MMWGGGRGGRAARRRGNSGGCRGRRRAGGRSRRAAGAGAAALAAGGTAGRPRAGRRGGPEPAVPRQRQREPPPRDVRRRAAQQPRRHVLSRRRVPLPVPVHRQRDVHQGLGGPRRVARGRQAGVPRHHAPRRRQGPSRRHHGGILPGAAQPLCHSAEGLGVYAVLPGDRHEVLAEELLAHKGLRDTQGLRELGGGRDVRAPPEPRGGEQEGCARARRRASTRGPAS